MPSQKLTNALIGFPAVTPHHGRMSDLVFHADSGNGSVSFADTLSIDIVSGELSAGGPVMASHSGGAWRIGEILLERITCEGPIHLEIQAAGERWRFGPFTNLVIGANTIWSASGAFARYSSFTKTWLLTKEVAEPLGVSSASRLAAA